MCAIAGYDLEPIGVNGALEAVNVHWFCSLVCASVEGFTKNAIGENPDALPGTTCEHCGVEISQPEAR